MKAMNYLFSALFVLVLGACTNEGQPIEEELKATDLEWHNDQEQTVYLELDFHQAFLVWEEQQIRIEMVQLEAEIENGGEVHEQLEEKQQDLERNRRDYLLNEELLDRYYRGPIGGGRPGKPCGDEPDPNFRCPIPRGDIGNLFLFNDQWEKGAIEVLTAEGEVCGEMVEMEPVSGGDEQFSRAVIEYDLNAAAQIRFTKLSDGQALFSYTIPIK